MVLANYVDFKKTALNRAVVVAAIGKRPGVADTAPMPKRAAHASPDVPGSNVRRLREACEWTLRALADATHPPLDHTTVFRLEANNGYTQDTLERIASALSRGLGRTISVAELFLPPELSDWPILPAKAQARIAETVQDAALASGRRKAG